MYLYMNMFVCVYVCVRARTYTYPYTYGNIWVLGVRPGAGDCGLQQGGGSSHTSLQSQDRRGQRQVRTEDRQRLARVLLGVASCLALVTCLAF